MLLDLVRANYKALHGVDPLGYDPSLTQHPLLGMDVSTVHRYACVSHTRGLIREAQEYYLSKTVEVGDIVTLKSGGFAHPPSIVLDHDEIGALHAYCSMNKEQMTKNVVNAQWVPRSTLTCIPPINEHVATYNSILSNESFTIGEEVALEDGVVGKVISLSDPYHVTLESKGWAYSYLAPLVRKLT